VNDQTISILALAAFLIVCYLVGSIPWSYLIVRWVTDEDISAHGTGNVGAMNVKRTTGSWGWFAVAMVADALKGLIPTLMAKGVLGGFGLDRLATPWANVFGPVIETPMWGLALLPMLAVLGTVLGHNYSIWLAFVKRRFTRTGKGLATGAGALLVYDWRYCLACLTVALVAMALTRIMMAGQVGAAIALPVTALVLRQPDWPFALLMGLIVYSAHHKRFIGMLQGKEPRLYTKDAMGPRG
jgi:glycerol-3-phosphate acyltransferase PlsY